ncbi:MAG: ribulose-phosphate 3-epimerase [Planctomycetaceae bacterium]|nr:ribulose-phosphate 3-epimerase [Planctomycetaceae bacterium]
MTRQSVLETLRSAAPVIAPSLLKCDFGNLQREVALLEPCGETLFHWDAMDGHFVPNLSYGAMVVERVRPMTRRLFDAHLMLSDPEKYIDGFIKAGCECITFHIEAVPEPTELLRRLRDADVVAGLALNPGTPVDRLFPYLEDVDQVLVMSVEPGFGGQKFIPKALDKLHALRKRMPADALLSVDGGIDPSTIGAAAAAGAQVFVAGSAVFDEPDYDAAIRELRKQAQDART